MADAVAGRSQRRAVDDLDLVVVRADVDPAGGRFQDGVVAAVVADRQASGLGTRRQAEQLMAEADAEDRRPARDGVRCAALGPSRSEAPSATGRPGRATAPRGPEPVAAMSAGVASGGSPITSIPRPAERGQERALDAVVDEDRPSAPLPVRSDPERLAGGDRGDMVDRLPGRAAPRPFDGFGLADVGGHDRRAARPRRCAAARVSARVSMPEIAGMPPSASSSSSDTPGPGGGSTRRVTTRPRAWTAVRLELGARDPVAPGHRVGQDDHLAGVGGIGQDLAPAGRGGREDEIALGREPAAVKGPGEDVCRPRAPGGPGEAPGAARRRGGRGGVGHGAGHRSPFRHHGAGLKGRAESSRSGPSRSV